MSVRSCSICGGELGRCARFAGEQFSECRVCGFIERRDVGAAAALEAYAEGAYEEAHAGDYLEEIAARRRDAGVRLDYLSRWCTRGRLLDVGTASGAFVSEASARGFDAEGVEPSPAFARMARDQLKVKVTNAPIEQFRDDGRPFAAITMWHVLEHLLDPVAQLRHLVALLDGDGVLAIEVPNAGGLAALAMGARWPSLQPDVHVNQFTPPTLLATLERAGMQVLDLRTTSVTPYLPLAARFAPRHVVARVKAALALRDARAVHPWGHELLRAVATHAPVTAHASSAA